MHTLTDVSLKLYSTMRLGGKAAYLREVTTKEELKESVEWAAGQNLPVLVVGQGSNIVWKDEGYKGLVIVNKITGFKTLDDGLTYKIGAGEDWDSVVARIVAKGLSGIECLSLIPGSTGATPVQNVGAYGEEIANSLIELECYDTKEKTFKILTNNECGFGYRTSRFKSTDKGRFFISSITLKLNKTLPKPPFYKTLQEHLDSRGITEYSPQVIRDAVISIRNGKLPDWHITATNGSFFENPIVSQRKYMDLKEQYPDIIGWEYEGRYKLSGGWLLETAGLKGLHDDETGMATSDKSALVVINEHAKSTAGLLRFRQKIIDKIKETFDIELEQEPELLP